LVSFKEGRSGTHCRGEEHEIELVWSVNSGKTRVFWNGINISHYFREEQLFEEVNFSWEARCGERFQIIAFEKPRDGVQQYDLLIDGSSFFSLPPPSQLQPVDVTDLASDISALSQEEDTAITTVTENSVEDGDMTTDDLDTLQQMHEHSHSRVDEYGEHDSLRLEDELIHDVFTSKLESVRKRAALIVPVIDDIVSRAVINAFTEDCDSLSRCSSGTFESMKPSSICIEANVVSQALSWMELNVDYAPRPDVQERKRLFLQKQVDSIFIHVRQGSLSEDAAVRVLSYLATLIGLEVKVPIRKDTILLQGINKYVEVEDVLCSLRTFGEVVDAAVSKARGIGICRFRYEDSAARVLAASATGTFTINGETPAVAYITPQPFRRHPVSMERAQSDPNPLLPAPLLKRTRSHQRNTITIDTAIMTAPFITADPNSNWLRPGISNKMLEPDVFSDIPTRSSSPVVFDSPPLLP
jgi:hypothetical protein